MTTNPSPKRRRTISKPPSLDHSVASPCIQVCWFSHKSAYCDGCWRTADEIRDWMIMDRRNKLAVLALIEQRKQAGFVEKENT